MIIYGFRPSPAKRKLGIELIFRKAESFFAARRFLISSNCTKDDALYGNYSFLRQYVLMTKPYSPIIKLIINEIGKLCKRFILNVL